MSCSDEPRLRTVESAAIDIFPGVSDLLDCCTPLAGSSLSEDDAGELERLFKLIADSSRLRILNMLVQADGEPVCVCEFTEALNVSQPTVSHHLKQLTEAGLLERERRGSFAYFRCGPARSTASASLLAPAARRSRLMPDQRVLRALVAEFIGTAALVFAGCGAIMVDAKTQALGHVGVAISFGLVIMVMIYAVGHVSGAHFNPAVTLRLRAHAALPLAARLALLGGAVRRCDCRSALPSRLARQHRPRRRHASVRLADAVVHVGAAADLRPDVRDHGRRHRYSRGRRGGGDRDRRNGRPGCACSAARSPALR